MKTLLEIISVCIVIIAIILPGTASASLWDITFTAESVANVGRINDGETIFQGDPDLFFAMQIYAPSAGGVTQIFFQDAYVSTTNWNFPDQSVSLTNVFTGSPFLPQVGFSFWLYDDDAPFGNPDLLGVHSSSTNSNITSTSIFNNNSKSVFLGEPLVSTGGGWQNNYLLTYSVSIIEAVPVVPIPPAVWLFGSGLIGLIGVARRKKASLF